MNGRVDEQRPQDSLTVDVTQGFGTGAFRMGHHAKNISVLVTDAGDIPERSIGVAGGNDIAGLVRIAIDHLVVGFQFIQHPVIRIVATFAVGDGYLQGPAFVACAPQIDISGNELPVGIAEQSPWKEMGFAKDLEPVADAKDLPAVGGEPGHALHNGTEAGDGPAAEVIAVGKPAGKHDTVIFAEAAQVLVLMPKHDYFLVQIGL